MPGTYIDVGANATYANNTSISNENEYQSIFVVPKSAIRLQIGDYPSAYGFQAGFKSYTDLASNPA